MIQDQVATSAPGLITLKLASSAITYKTRQTTRYHFWE